MQVEAMLRAHDKGASALSGPSSVTAPQLRTGMRLGAYEIVGELRTGGMGGVYRAFYRI
jgi:hypothetical protein